jgi:hypothetical protein
VQTVPKCGGITGQLIGASWPSADIPDAKRGSWLLPFLIWWQRISWAPCRYP